MIDVARNDEDLMSPQDHGGLRVEASSKNDQASKSGLISQAFKGINSKRVPPRPLRVSQESFPLPLHLPQRNHDTDTSLPLQLV